MHSHKNVSLNAVSGKCIFILQHSKITFYMLCFSSHIMKRYLGLESKSLGGCSWPWPPGLGTDTALVLALEFAD